MLEKGLHESYISNLGLSVSLNIPDKPTATVQIIHGMNEHKERYYPFMKFLGGMGFATLTADIRGHGKSVDSPENLGYIDRTENAVIRGINNLEYMLESDFPDMPRFIIGHSMGSLIARNYMNFYGERLDGIFLLGTPCYTKLSVFADMINTRLEKKSGTDYRNVKITERVENFLNRNFEDIPHSWICSNADVVREFNADPLCSFTYTLSGYDLLLKLMRMANNDKIWKNPPKNPDIPIRFISGKDDPCMISENKFFESIEFLENAGYRNITHRLYENMRHEVLNETDKYKVWEDIAENLLSWRTKIT